MAVYPFDEASGEQASAWLADHLRKFLIDHVLPNAAQSDADDFRRRAAHPPVRLTQRRLMQHLGTCHSQRHHYFVAFGTFHAQPRQHFV